MRFLNKQLSLALAIIFTCNASAFAQQWSRQLTADTPVTADDWVPIRNGKTINFGQDLVPAAQQTFQFFTDPNNQFSLRQQHPAHASHPAAASEVNSFQQPPPPPPFQFFNNGPQKQRTIQNFGGPLGGQNKPLAEPLVQSPPPFQYMQEVQRGPHVVHYQSQPIPKSLQNFPQFPQSRAPQFQKIPPPPPQFQAGPTPPPFQPLQNEQNEQLLYVPFDSLYQNGQQTDNDKANRFNILNQPVSASLINDFYSHNEVQDFGSQSTTGRPAPSPTPTIQPVSSSLNPTTPFETSSKLKPHQPPLSMFVATDKFKGKITETDVLHTLKKSNSIDVMDTVSKNAPKVFIGPSGMPAPTGYTKFDLPYLSNIEGTRHERRIEQLPFFVAPLSYRTPPGFSKIPLPAPHVGSVVVNQPPNSIDSDENAPFTPDNYYTKPQAIVGSTIQPQNKKVALTTGFAIGPNGNVNLIQNDFTFPTLSPSGTPSQEPARHSTPRPTFAQTASPTTPLTKVPAALVDTRNFGHSTHNPTTTRTPVTKFDYFPTSPRSSARQTTTTRAPLVESEQYRTVNEEYFGIEKQKRPTFSFKFGSEVDKPTSNFNFRPIPDFNFEETTRKPKTKPTTQEPTRTFFPSSTPNPTPSFDYTPTVSAIENTDSFAQINGGSTGNFFEFRTSAKPDFTYNSNRFNFGTQNTAYTPQYTEDNSETVKDTEEELTTDNPAYNLPSELPAISAQLPGWINSLMDDKWMQSNNITEESTTATSTTTTTTTTTTRRPNRGSRRPVSARVTATESTVERRPVTRRSRPTTFPSRTSPSSTEATFPSRSTQVTRGSKVRYNSTSEDRGNFRSRTRTPAVKSPDQNIEYQRDVLNQNYPSSIRPLAEIHPTTERLVENIHIHNEVATSEQIVNDYNTPLESVEVIPLGGNSPSHNEHFYENTIETSTLNPTTYETTTFPSNHKYSSVEPHKTVAHRLKANFNYKNRNTDSFYNTKLTYDPRTTTPTTLRTEDVDDEVLITVPSTPVPTTTTTTEAATTEATPVPKRTSFPRRRLPYTTTEATGVDGESTESSRTRGRKENVVVVKKVRGRVRQTTTTETPVETTRRTVAVRTRTSYNRNSNRDSNRERASENNEEEPRPRFRIRENTPRFRLDTQESQWSSNYNQNSFQPIDGEKSKAAKNVDIDDEQEIVTAGPNDDDSYLVNVSASVVPTKPAQTPEAVDETDNMVTTTTEKDVVVGKRIKNEDDLGKSFEKFVKDVLEDIETEGKSDAKVEKKPVGSEKKGAARRGVWKRVKVRPADGFETAETQNIGKHLYNSVGDKDKAEGEKKSRVGVTTSKPVEVATTEIPTTTQAPLEHVFSETTTIEPETVESKTGMFDEARKALTDFFSTEDESDDAVNMEEADDRLEALQDSTTTTQIPTTEESVTTTIPPTESTPKESIVKKSSKQVKTSTSQKVTGEICFRGRCVKTVE